MANLAKKFNNEYFSNEGVQQMEYFKVNNNQENYKNSTNYDMNLIEENTIDIPNRKQENKNLVIEKNMDNKCKQATKDFSCEELIEKVLSCDKCRKMILSRLNIKEKSISEIFNHLLKGTNKEVIILILIGLIIIILLDLFIRIGRSLD
jgi:hypothetical protein